MDFEREQLGRAGAELVAARCADQDELMPRAAGAAGHLAGVGAAGDGYVLGALPECSW